MAAPRAVRIELSEAERGELEARLRRRKLGRSDALRAQIVLLAAEGLSNLAIVERLGVADMMVAMWRHRFAELRMDGLAEEPRPGAPRTVSDEKVAEVVTATLEILPAGRTHWSSRGMARAAGLAPSTVQRIWKAFSLQPHRVETFKLSTDPLSVEKVRDIVGLYLSPPERALVLCVDEKSQIQALDRTQPLLPLRPGQVERRIHDCKRCGTTSLFAALDVKAGTVIGKCVPRHRAAEFRRFLETVEARVPANLDVHVMMGQGCEPQDEAHSELVRQAAALARPLHADLGLLDQASRAVLCAADRRRHPEKRLPFNSRTRSRHQSLHRHPQRRTEAVHLDEMRRGHPRRRPTLLPAHRVRPGKVPGTFKIRTLGFVKHSKSLFVFSIKNPVRLIGATTTGLIQSPLCLCSATVASTAAGS